MGERINFAEFLFILVVLYATLSIITSEKHSKTQPLIVGDRCIGNFMFHVARDGTVKQLLTHDNKGIECGKL